MKNKIKFLYIFLILIMSYNVNAGFFDFLKLTDKDKNKESVTSYNAITDGASMVTAIMETRSVGDDKSVYKAQIMYGCIPGDDVDAMLAAAYITNLSKLSEDALKLGLHLDIYKKEINQFDSFDECFKYMAGMNGFLPSGYFRLKFKKELDFSMPFRIKTPKRTFTPLVTITENLESTKVYLESLKNCNNCEKKEVQDEVRKIIKDIPKDSEAPVDVKPEAINTPK